MELKALLKLGVEKGASDIHITPNAPVVFRINGELIPINPAEVSTAKTTQTLIHGVLDEKQRKMLDELRELDFAILDPDVANFRVNAFYQVHGLAAVCRVIPSVIPTLESINAPEVFKTFLQMQSGLLLVAGPTGCGKSTTIAAMINYINANQSNNIITIEDPIEFTHTNIKSLINQRQVNRDTKSFANALRSALREDPDIILVGEMRDLETIRLALTAAEMGHLVMATLHTSAAPRAISRIIDVFPAGEKNIIKNMISESLQAVVCQTLLPKIGGGRIAAYEIMIGVTAVRHLIREDKIAQMYTVIQTNSDKGMCTMSQYVQKLIDSGVVDAQSAHGIGFEREAFEISQ